MIDENRRKKPFLTSHLPPDTCVKPQKAATKNSELRVSKLPKRSQNPNYGGHEAYDPAIAVEDDDGVGGDASRERAERGEWESPHLDYEREWAMEMGTIKYPSIMGA